MQKIVVGIIAVFFVQVGFQVYSAVGSTNYAYRSISTEPAAEVLAKGTGVAPAIDYLYLASYRPTPSSDRNPIKASDQKQNILQPDRVIHAVARTRKAPMATSAAIGKDIIITIPPRPAASYKAVNAVTAATPRPEKKRGFFAKSFHVLKKPYDWMKTVAMKLD